MLRQVYNRLPQPIKERWRTFKDTIKSIPYYLPYSGNRRFCPVCQRSSRSFRQFGIISRDDARCFHCGSLERHRLLWLFLSKRTNLFDGKAKKVLHVAPEPCFEERFRKHLGQGYLTADLLAPNVMVKMDITDIQYPDESFDVIYCSHVLEHVPDDRKAMREFFRVLKSGGWAILLVPITVQKTFEDPSITDPIRRLELFGQQDHVRRYGIDYVDRLKEAGFEVQMTRVNDLVDSDEAIRMGLTVASGEIYFCRKGKRISDSLQLGVERVAGSK